MKIKFKNLFKKRGDMSDGYHTFNELYDHRTILFALVCKLLKDDYVIWKSKKHHDGTMFKDMFIVGIDTDFGQITYHCTNSHWNLFSSIIQIKRAPQFDGHTSDDVLIRLRQLLETTWGGESLYDANVNCIVGNSEILGTKTVKEIKDI